MSKPNRWDRLKSIRDRMAGLDRQSPEYLELKRRYDEIVDAMPKYRPHVWRKHGL